jgi:hypothetical protein
VEPSQSRVGLHFQPKRPQERIQRLFFCLFIIISAIGFSVRFKYVNKANVEVLDNSKDEISAHNAASS